MRNFNTNKEALDYIDMKLEKLIPMNECRLYREEQIFGELDNTFKVRNILEWIIRTNKVFIDFKYSFTKGLYFAKLMETPLEETENKNKYSYHLENSLYRLIVLWDMFKQALNVYYELGYNKENNYKIYDVTRKMKSMTGEANTLGTKIYKYLNNKNHKYLRETLRNSYTHGVDPTSLNIFHDKNSSGFYCSDFLYFPEDPIKNFVMIVDDIEILWNYFMELNKKVENLAKNEIFLCEGEMTTKCNIIAPIQKFNLNYLLDNLENIGVQIETEKCNNCEHWIEFEGVKGCKPIKLSYHRIYENEIENINF